MTIERTLALIKTGAVLRCQTARIQARMKIAGLEHVRHHTFGESIHTGDRILFEKLYAAHIGCSYYEDLLSSVDRSSLVIVLTGEDAIARWRALMGPTDPALARAEAPESIRGLFAGAAMPDNAVHGSDSVEAAEREIAIFFPDMVE